jgi:hypothetical protein
VRFRAPLQMHVALKDIEIGNDIDLSFIVGTEERAQMIMEFVLVDVLQDHTSFRTGNAVTFFVKDAINGDIPDHPEATHRYPTRHRRVRHRTVQSGYLL